MIESGVTFDYGQLVMDDEFVQMIKHIVQGVPVDDETMAVEDIARIGSFGDFLSLDATMKHMRSLSQPKVLDRRVREDWVSMGSTDLAQRCTARAVELIESHQPTPLDADVAAELKAIIAAADREKGVS